jgi:PPOX class probable F420-dependent enzyme
MPKRLSRAEWGRFLKGRHVAVLGTIGTKGEPVLTPIWYLFRGGKLLMRTGKTSKKARNIQRDPRVTVCVQDERPPYASVTIYGAATVAPEEAGLGLKIARRYLGAIGGAAYMKVAAEAIEQEGGEVTLVITPERALTQDFSAETPIYGRAWLMLKRILPPAL